MYVSLWIYSLYRMFDEPTAGVSVVSDGTVTAPKDDGVVFVGQEKEELACPGCFGSF
jgi:hypothetical protein